jgi:uncharacterized membrane protein YkoI
LILKKKWLVTTAMLAAIAGVSGAMMTSAFPSANAAVAGSAVQAADQSDGDGEVADAQEKADKEVADDQEKGGTEVSDANEQAALAGQAKITKDQAVQAAIAQVKGTVKDTHLEDENGVVVYNVAVIDDQKQTTEVKVDAISGKVLKAEKDAGDENGQDGQEAQDDQETKDDQNQDDNGADGEQADD